MANITCSFFIINLADMTKTAIYFTPPEVMEDMSATIMQETLVNFSEESQELLTIETPFSSRHVAMTGFLFFIPSELSTRNILQYVSKIPLTE